MSLGMKRDDLVQSLKYQLNDAATVFNNADDDDFIRHLDNAALDMGRVRPRRLSATVSLVASQPNYAVPATVLRVASSPWGTEKIGKPWETDYAGPLPRPELAGDFDELELWLEPTPTARQIELLGATYRYYYYAAHEIGEAAADTTVRAEDRALLLLRATAEALCELALRGAKKPTQLRDGLQSGPKNGTPAGLYEQLMKQFNMQARW